MREGRRGGVRREAGGRMQRQLGGRGKKATAVQAFPALGMEDSNTVNGGTTGKGWVGESGRCRRTSLRKAAGP